jgi:ubiquinone/menaquinone biosynthesis C-methylase UbiE
MRPRLVAAVAAVAVTSLVLAATLGAQRSNAATDAADARRLVDALAVGPGQTVCELGAGAGTLSVAMAQTVGPDGRVYANELNPDRLRDIEAAAKTAGLGNVSLVTGDAEGTNLPDAACDALFMRNVYHHFADPPTMNASIRRALKPGGRVAVIDFDPTGTESAAPADRDEEGHHGVTAPTVAAELKAAGFNVLSSDTSPSRGFLVVAQSPAP